MGAKFELTIATAQTSMAAYRFTVILGLMSMGRL